MAHLEEHDIASLKTQFKLDTFFESGTGNCEGILHAKDSGFELIHTVDCIDQTTTAAISKCPWAKVHLGQSSSVISAFQTMRKVEPPFRVLWWLDAHFPGVDTKINTWEDTFNSYPMNERLPLCDELDSIVSGPWEHDVIIIDDAFIYRAGLLNQPVTERVPDWTVVALGSIESRLDKMSSTHRIECRSEGTGSFLLTPNDPPV